MLTIRVGSHRPTMQIFRSLCTSLFFHFFFSSYTPWIAACTYLYYYPWYYLFCLMICFGLSCFRSFVFLSFVYSCWLRTSTLCLLCSSAFPSSSSAWSLFTFSLGCLSNYAWTPPSMSDFFVSSQCNDCRQSHLHSLSISWIHPSTQFLPHRQHRHLLLFLCQSAFLTVVIRCFSSSQSLLSVTPTLSVIPKRRLW